MTGANLSQSWQPVGPNLEFGVFGVRAAAPPVAPADGSGPPKAVGNGSGFIVSRAGDVITNNHVVQGCREVKILRDDKPVAVRVIDTDPAGDIAIVRLPGPVDEIALFRAASAKPGESVLVVGYPLQGFVTSDASVTTGIVSALTGPRNDKKLLQITAPVQRGNSGGPTVDSTGAIIGVVVSKLNGLKIAQLVGDIPENVNFAVNANLARALLDKNGVK